MALEVHRARQRDHQANGPRIEESKCAVFTAAQFLHGWGVSKKSWPRSNPIA
jgi:hypothetical protein